MKKTVLFFLVVLLAATLGFAGGQKEVAVEGEQPFRIAALYQTAIEEPWDGVIHQACLQAQKELGVEYEFTEKIAAADFEKVLREYAERGFDLIVGDAFLAGEDPARRVAKDYPEIAFAFGSEFGPVAPNFSVFDNWIHEPAFLCGVIAGRMTKSNTLGVVAAIPIGEVNRLVNAFKAGALSVNPDIKVKIAYIGGWFDPPKAKEAALAQIAAGADQIYALSFGPFEACREKGIQAYGHYVDQQSMDPDTIVVSTMALWDPGVNFVINEWYQHKMGRKSFDGPMEPMIWFMNEGGADLAPLGAWEKKLSPALVKEVEAKRQAIKDGTFKVPFNANKVVSD